MTLSVIEDSEIKKIRKKYAPNNSWIMACAGAGKTRSLIFRFLRLLLIGNDSEKIICITYTKAAAFEMESRINDYLRKWVICDEEELKNSISEIIENEIEERLWPFFLEQARNLFFKISTNKDGLKISTIHSFCQSLLKKFPLEAGISSDFQIIDDNLAFQLLQETRIKVLTNDKISIYVQNFAKYFSDFQIQKIFDEIIINKSKIKKIINQFNSLQEYLKFLKQALNIGELNSEENFINLIEKRKEHLLNAANHLCESTSAMQLSRGIAIKKFCSERKNLDEYVRQFVTLKNEPTKSLVLKSIAKKYPHVEDVLRNEQNLVLEMIEKRNSEKIFNASKALTIISNEFINQYETLKAKDSFIDYDDIINLTINLLKNSNSREWVLYKLEGGMDHILLDEAQDTSPLQWEIIKLLSQDFFVNNYEKGDKSLFIVGDQKQSIFSFQGANVDYFNLMKDDFIKKGSAFEASSFEERNLNKSYRSTPEVLGLVDKIFSSQQMSDYVSNIGVTHEIHRKNSQGHVSVLPIIENIDGDDSCGFEMLPNHVESKNLKNETAKLLSEKIVSMVGKKFLPSKNRLCKASDIMVLVRKRDDFAKNLVKFLKNANIQTAGLDRINLNDEIIILDLLSFAKFVLLPEDDLNLAAILRSPIFNISQQDLFELAFEREQSLWQELKNNEKHCHAYELLDDVKQQYFNNSLFGFFNYLIETLEFRQIFIAVYGKEVEDLIDEFLNQIMHYQKNIGSSMQAFIAWFEAKDLEIKRDNNAQDQLRVMTVHASKGLQSAVVFLIDPLSQNSSSNLIMFEDDVENSLFLVSSSVAECNNHMKNLSQIKKDQEYAEYIRLLYVGLTRAEDELIMCGYGSRKNDKCWYSIVEKYVEEVDCSINNLLQPTHNIDETEVSENQLELGNLEFLSFNVPVTEVKNPDKHDKHNFIRGKILHDIFQTLPDVPKDKINAFLVNKLSQYETDIDKMMNLMNEFPWIFDRKNIDSEFPISNGYGSFFIDRLVYYDKEIKIIEFKTDSYNAFSPRDLPSVYLKQVQNYENIMKNIFHDKKISKYILWLENTQLFKI